MQDMINILNTVFSVIVGTYVERKIEQFMKSRASKKTDIDDLVLFEQGPNSIEKILARVSA